MMTSDRLTMISESTFDSSMRRSMERLEEKLHRGDRSVEIEIHEMLHLLSRVVSLECEVKMFQEMLYRTFNGYSDHYNMEVNRNTLVSIPGEKDIPTSG